MKINEIENLNEIKRLSDGYLNKLKPNYDKTEPYTVEIKLRNYSELGCIISGLLELCVVALNESGNPERGKNVSTNISTILEVALQLLPVDEFDLLTEIQQALHQNE